MLDRLESAYQTALAALLAERHPEGYWIGELSTSALSTATAVMALHQVRAARGLAQYDPLIEGGLSWLAVHQNEDGGWGDTVKSLSNISTTMLCRAAFHLTGAALRFAQTVTRCEYWLAQRYGSTPAELAEAVRQRYGKDRTFAVPILTTCALADLVSWDEVPSLPFELACFPQWMFRFLRLHVVSYALPALIAIGQCIHHHRKPRNPIARLVRAMSRKRSLRVLERIQPSNGGFLEATPLTSFVTLSLASIGLAEHPVARKGAEFIAQSVRPDGSWPIDTNLSTWVTTLSMNALAACLDMGPRMQRDKVYNWLRGQQFLDPHPYTGAAPGGWGWTPLPGSVPDADDTPGAILTLHHINPLEGCPHIGLDWLLNLQNADGGWPTFCRGWGHLPFDRSGADLTAHVLRAFHVWLPRVEYEDQQARKYIHLTGVPLPPHRESPAIEKAMKRGLVFLVRSQRPDGSWLPLWFGNQHAPDDLNPTYGTARVLAAYRDLQLMDSEPAKRGVRWLLDNQNDDGGWGGCKGTPSSIEETSLAVEVLLDAPVGQAFQPDGQQSQAGKPDLQAAVQRGLEWLIGRIEAGGLREPTPIGFYFAKLWYYEKLYPIIFAVAALGRARLKMKTSPGSV